MQVRFQDFPPEVFREIFEQGGLDLLAGSLGLTCRRINRLSRDITLWRSMLESFTDTVPIPVEHLHIDWQNPGKWYRDQALIDREVIRIINKIVRSSVKPTSSTQDMVIEEVSKLVEFNLRALPQLERIIASAETLAHYHWAIVIKDHLAKVVTGAGQLLLIDQSQRKNPSHRVPQLRAVIATMYMCFRQFPGLVIKRLLDTDWKLRYKEHFGSSHCDSPFEKFSTQPSATLEWARQQLLYVDETIFEGSDFFTILLRCHIYCHIMEKCEHSVKLISFASLTYCQLDTLDCDGKPLFVDFSKYGGLRSLEEIQIRVRATGTNPSEIRVELKVTEILAAMFLYGKLPPVDNNLSVKNLIKLAARQVNVKNGRLSTALFDGLLRIFMPVHFKDFDTVEPRAILDDDKRSPIDVGDICQILDQGGVATGDLLSSQINVSRQQPSFCVVLEARDLFYKVMRGSSIVFIHRTALRPGFDVPTTTVANMLVPDIPELDYFTLGEYFFRFDPKINAFTNSGK